MKKLGRYRFIFKFIVKFAKIRTKQIMEEREKFMPHNISGLNSSSLVKAIVAIVFLALSTSVSTGPAGAQTAKIKTGILTCHSEGGVGLILGSKEDLKCTYVPTGGGQTYQYVGTITRIGLDIGFRGKSTIIWAVLGSTDSLPGEALGGTFVGVSADIAVGIGAGANILLGGNKKSVVLQPLSVKGETGLDIAVTVSTLKLVPVQ